MPAPLRAKTADSGSSGSNGFISKISEGFTSGLTSIGKDVLPVWAANQLGVESRDQTSQPVYDRGAVNAPQRQDNLLTGGNISPGLTVGGVQLSKPVMIGGGVAALALIVFMLRK